MKQPNLIRVFDNKQKRPVGVLSFELVPANRNTAVIGKSFNNYSYAIDHGWVSRSIDGFVTKTNGMQPAATIGIPCHLTAWPDGTLFIASVEGKLATMASISDTPVITQTGVGFAGLSISTYSDGFTNYVLAGEYAQTTTAKKLFLSVDGGATFAQIKESTIDGINNSHWHGICFDPYFHRIWAAQGDGPNAITYYSDDMGANWMEVIVPSVTISQPTFIYSLRNRLVVGRDASPPPPGIDVWNRTQDLVSFSPALEFRKDKYGFNFYPTRSRFAIDGENILYIMFPNQTIDTNEHSYIYATGDGGLSWHCVYDSNRLNFTIMGGVNGMGNRYIYAGGATIAQSLYRAKPLVWVDDN